MYGHGLLLPIPDIDHTDFMLILGGNPLASNGSIMTVPDVEKRLKALQARRAPGGGRPAAQRNGGDGRSASVHPPRWRCGAVVRLLIPCSKRPGRGSHLPVNGLEQVREAIAPFMPRR
jgi:anaerobic selenocysteine-containing dehydrogenase